MMEESEFMIQLVFDMTRNPVERQKIQEFWEIIRKQRELQPYVPPTEERNENLQVPIEAEKKNLEVEDWLTIPKKLKDMGLDKVVYSTPCRTDNRIFRLTHFKYADEIEESYEELNNDLKAFEERKKIEKVISTVIEEIITKIES